MTIFDKSGIIQLNMIHEVYFEDGVFFWSAIHREYFVNWQSLKMALSVNLSKVSQCQTRTLGIKPIYN